MKKKIIITSIIIIIVILITFVLRISIKNIIITALTIGGFSLVMSNKKKIRKNNEEIKERKKEFEHQEKKILSNDYSNFNLATDPTNIYIHKRIKSRRNKRNNTQ